MHQHIEELLPIHKDQLVALFRESFTAAEGENEGLMLASLVSDLAEMIDKETVSCFGTWQEEQLIGAVFVTQLSFDEDYRVQMLAPVAVATPYQRQGVGQTIIQAAIDCLAERKIDLLVTYGDPAYYSKTGFSPLSVTEVPAPYHLSMPIGWQGQVLNRAVPPALTNPRSVPPFRQPELW